MSTNSLAAPASDTGSFWSIERSVAFVVGPIVSAGAGWLSLFLANNVPGLPTVPGEAIYALAGAATISTAALFHKWLDGRSKQTQQLGATVHNVENFAQPLLDTAGITPAIESGGLETLRADLERMAENAAARAVGAIHKSEVEQPAQPQPPPVQPIQPATSDPAPATPVQAQAADAGAAPVS
jgi:hypothetical protein